MISKAGINNAGGMNSLMWKSNNCTRPDGAGLIDKEDQLSQALRWSRGLLESDMEVTC